MECLKCESKKIIKYGKNKRGNQTYKCNTCKIRFIGKYKNKSYVVSDTSIITLVKEGCGIRSMARILNISPTTVISRIKRTSNSICRPFSIVNGKEYEIDELCTYLGNKKKRIWITYALRKDTREIIDFTVGARSMEVMSKVTNTVLFASPKKVYTDRYRNYKSLIPIELHITRKRCINYIERMNLNLRTHLKRLNRKTICYTKSSLMLTACLKIYFWG